MTSTDTADEPDFGSDYVQPADRPAAWAAMAADLAADGRTIPEIADALCIDEPTVLLLLAPVPAERAA